MTHDVHHTSHLPLLRSVMGQVHQPRDPRATSRLMAAVRRQNTEPELALRRSLWQLGLRYRLHDRSLPGTPDLVFARARVVVFVDGDYWHGRILKEQDLRALQESFRTRNRDLWVDKICRNVARDSRQTAALTELGWCVMRLWERDILRSPGRSACSANRRWRRRRWRPRGRGREVPRWRGRR